MKTNVFAFAFVSLFSITGCLSSVSPAQYSAQQQELTQLRQRAERAEQERDRARDDARHLAVDGPGAVADASAPADASVASRPPDAPVAAASQVGAPSVPVPMGAGAMPQPYGSPYAMFTERVGVYDAQHPGAYLAGPGASFTFQRISLPYGMAIQVDGSWVAMYQGSAAMPTQAVVREGGSYVSVPVAAPGSGPVTVMRTSLGLSHIRIFLLTRLASGTWAPYMFREFDAQSQTLFPVTGDAFGGFVPCSSAPGLCNV